MFKKLIVTFIILFVISIFLPFLLMGATGLYVLFINPGKTNFERKFVNTAMQYLAIPETFSVISDPVALNYFFLLYFPFEYITEGPIATYYDDFYGRLEWEDDFGKYSLIYRPFYGDKSEILLGVPTPNFPFMPKNNKEYIVTLLVKTKDPSLTKDNMMSSEDCLKEEYVGKIQSLLTHLFKKDVIVKPYKQSCALAYFYKDSTQPSSIQIYFDKTMNMNVNNITKVWYNPQNIRQYDERF